MKAAYWQRGESLDYRNNTGKKIEAGTVLVMGKRIAIAGADIPAGEMGAVHVSGVFEFEKADTTEITAGTEVYYCDDGITAAEKAGEDSNVPAGYAAANAEANSTKVLVKINA